MNVPSQPIGQAAINGRGQFSRKSFLVFLMISAGSFAASWSTIFTRQGAIISRPIN